MSKVMKYVIPIAFLIISIFIMLSNALLKNVLRGDEIPVILDEILEDVNNEKWEQAQIKVNEIKTINRNILKIIQFSAERDELNSFNQQLSVLEGYLYTTNQSEAIVSVFLLKAYWLELTS
jgi:hypothetical protein